MRKVRTTTPSIVIKLNHIGSTPPSVSERWQGMVWFDTSSSPPLLKFWDGSGWIEIGTPSNYTPTQTPTPNSIPVSLSDGKLHKGWIDDSMYLAYAFFFGES